MNPSARRILIPLAVAAVALGVVLVGVVGPRPAASPAAGTTVADAAGAPDAAAPPGPAAPPPRSEEAEPAVVEADEAAPGSGEAGGRAGADTLPSDLRAVAPARGVRGHDEPVPPLGSLDPAVAPVHVEFSRAGAGISRVTFSDIWESAAARRQAAAHRRALERGAASAVPAPDDALRYVLQEANLLRNAARGAGLLVPLLATNQLEVEGRRVNIFDYNRGADGAPVYIWASIDTGTDVRTFETRVEDDQGAALLRVVRRFVLNGFDLTIEQRIENLTDRPLAVRWIQYGPGSLRLDRSRYMDRRRWRFGVLPDPAQYPDRTLVLTDDKHLLIERNELLKRGKKADQAAVAGDPALQRELLTLWPTERSQAEAYELSWFSATNRYFGVAVHPALREGGSRSLAPVVERIMHEISDPDPLQEGNDDLVIFTYLLSPLRTIEPGATLDLDLGVYAGPLDRNVLEHEPYTALLAMQKLILYQMSSFCAICTFQWLAHLLLGFLTILHDYVVFDWGLAIIGLVIVVRLILHPITKRSQVSMRRFGKQMGSMKPELDKLQKKFGHDPKKMQQEQMRLMREHGLNPLQMLGCLPMFLQTPIWIALYAMLYFAFDIRHEAAFFGIFQKLTGGAWPFLADLSAGDHFFGEVAEPFKFFMWNVTGYNLLPILMGVIFYIQQKYMSPPPSPTMTDDQLRQQKIMKVMMVVMFPLMLYSAPSGLTLYILTSSCIGIMESRYIRAHVKEMDLNPKKKKAARPRVKPKDAQGRAYAAAVDRMQEKRREKQRGPTKSYKKRKRD